MRRAPILPIAVMAFAIFGFVVLLYNSLHKNKVNSSNTLTTNTAINQNVTTSNNLNTSSPSTNTFFYSSVKVGDRVGPMVVSTISPYYPDSTDKDKNFIVGFTGVVTLTGRISSRLDGIGNQVVYFTDLNEQSVNQIPHTSDDVRPFSVYFTNIDDVIKVFPTGTNQPATVRIDNYMILSPNQFYSYDNPLRILGSATFVPNI